MDRDAVQAVLLERTVGFKANLNKIAREYHTRVMATREAVTTYQQLKLNRQNELREANAAVTIISFRASASVCFDAT